MTIWKNGRKATFMYGENKLRHDDVQQAVNSMTFCGLQIAAASFLLMCQKLGLSPKDTMEILESEGKIESIHCRESNRA